jgi:hypothetical protein
LEDFDRREGRDTREEEKEGKGSEQRNTNSPYPDFAFTSENEKTAAKKSLHLVPL